MSIQEELEAVDWYDQRVEATTDESLAAVLAHNRDEEKEHAAMTIEWLRRNDPVLDGHLRTYLFTSEPITAVEAEAEGAAAGRRARRRLTGDRKPAELKAGDCYPEGRWTRTGSPVGPKVTPPGRAVRRGRRAPPPDRGRRPR